jgi:hypothetical protein
MDFSPEEDIQIVLAKSATEAQPKAGSAILSHRAEKRVRRNSLCIIFLMDSYAARSESQAGKIEGET